ncbi:MAG: hydantoinase/oxoprolinase family protein [Acidimicrobiia bacterium]|nr:hydantoinase/oxoprolinase family protein [Acidimicrobiia bacterium]
MRIGIDAGGTFTDFIVLHKDGRMESFKLRSNPRAPARVILEGLARAAGTKPADVVHGSTVATNALLERKGARTALLTTKGFEDLLHIGRQNRAELYNLTPLPRRPLVPRKLCFGVPERTLYDGAIAARPDPAALSKLAQALRRARVEAVAVCLLHSYQNPQNEKEVAAALAGLGYLCASHQVSPEFREYERASTTLINAYVGPLMDAYLKELENSRHSISILQSNGGFLSAAQARRQAVRTVLSGPAGGVIGAIHLARLSGYRRILGFDMGGTSTDVSLCDGAVRETTEASVDGFPVRVPMLDIHTVGAGGGSLARVDAGGLLRVGPESAGADPGPACYGIGSQATVTDAHVVMGRITARQFLGGEMEISVDRAAKAIDAVANSLGMERMQAAEGIIRVANANMERAIRAVSIERGHDPRRFALIAFGGGGGLHACHIAAELGIRTVVVPRYAEGLSALGMLLADRVRDYSAGLLGRAGFAKAFRELEKQARQETRGARIERTADLRYAGQSYELNVPWRNREEAAAAFHKEHHRVYGYSDPARPVEVVTIRVRARVETRKPGLRPLPSPSAAKPELRKLYLDGRWRQTPVFHRNQIGRAAKQGPALILDYGSTTLVPSNWRFRLDRTGNLELKLP